MGEREIRKRISEKGTYFTNAGGGLHRFNLRVELVAFCARQVDDNSGFTIPLPFLSCLSDRVPLLIHRLIYEAVVKRLFDASLFGFGMVANLNVLAIALSITLLPPGLTEQVGFTSAGWQLSNSTARRVGARAFAISS